MRLYIDEDVPAPAVAVLLRAGHDILTAHQAGMANQALSDEAQHAYTIANGRVIVTNNRNHFSRLHRRGIAHRGIVLGTGALKAPELGQAIAAALAVHDDLSGRLLRVTSNGAQLDPPLPQKED